MELIVLALHFIFDRPSSAKAGVPNCFYRLPLVELLNQMSLDFARLSSAYMF